MFSVLWKIFMDLYATVLLLVHGSPSYQMEFQDLSDIVIRRLLFERMWRIAVIKLLRVRVVSV